MSESNFDLHPIELLQYDELQAEHQRLLARYGAATLELESVRAALPQWQQRQRGLFDQAAARNGVSVYLQARVEGKRLMLRLPEGQPANGHEPE